MHNRSRLVGELDGEWKTGHLMSAQQKDGNSCGPFVLMVSISNRGSTNLQTHLKKEKNSPNCSQT